MTPDFAQVGGQTLVGRNNSWGVCDSGEKSSNVLPNRALGSKTEFDVSRRWLPLP
jgi:hypothetical protein